MDKKINVELEAALQHINLGNYEKAMEKLQALIDSADEAQDEIKGAQYRCILGELYAQLGKKDEASKLFSKILEIPSEKDELSMQHNIARRYLEAFAGKAPMPGSPRKVAPSVPMMPKPTQNKGFIAKKMTRK